MNIRNRPSSSTKGRSSLLQVPAVARHDALTERIGRLIERGETPESILAFTFTNAAADEMKKRLATKLGDEMVGTVEHRHNAQSVEQDPS